MTGNHPLRHALARVCSAETMTRIVDPILADMRWEDGGATLRGCVALARALALHAFTSTPAWAAAVWADDQHAVPKTAAFVLATAFVAAILLLAPELSHIPERKNLSPVSIAATLLPQALALTLPGSLLLAIPLSLRRVRVSARLIRRTLLLSTAVAAANFAVVVYALPDANQSFREAVARSVPADGHSDLTRGPNETHLATLRRQIEDLKRTRGGAASARRLEYVFQLRLAIIAAAVPLGLAGLVVSAPRRARARVLLGIGILVAYWALMLYEEHAVKALIDSGGFLPEYLCAWMPNALLLITALAILRVRHSALTERTPLSPSINP